MRLATWNVNSIRTRVDRVMAFLEREHIDVLAMQEIKCKPEQFPREPFEAAGYELAVHGLNQWNGVAVASRVGLSDVETSFPGQPTWDSASPSGAVVEARALGVTVGGRPAVSTTASAPGTAAPASAPVRLWSLYVPNGRELTHPHYSYKLDWLRALREDVDTWLAEDPGLPLALVGDWNVAPRDEDVWDMAAFEGATHVSSSERAAFTAFEQVGMEEVTRSRVTNYTYWDYQKLRFPRNEGMRIDFVYASAALAARVTGAAIDRDERKGKGASDHVPVIVEIS
nr:exodeoxyribonuclease III [Actinomyces sp.]